MRIITAYAGDDILRVWDAETLSEIHEIRWDGTNDAGEGVGSGVYFYRMTTTGLDEAKRMVVVR